MLITKHYVTDMSQHDAETLPFDIFRCKGKWSFAYIFNFLFKYTMGISFTTKFLNIEWHHFCDIN